MVRPVLRRRRKKWYTIAARPVTGGVSPPLDAIVMNAGAAYSYRRLRTAYAGNPAMIQREDTTAHQDIGFAGNDFDATAFNAYVAGTTGHTRIWYDQSGNGNDATANLAAALPVTASHVPDDHGRYGAFTTVGSASYMVANDNASIQNIWAAGGFVAIVFRVENIPATFGAPMIAKGTSAGWEIFTYNTNPPYQNLLYLKASTTDGSTWLNDAVSLSTLHLITIAWNASTPATPATVTLDGVACSLKSSATPVGTFCADSGQGLYLFNDNVLDTLANAYGGGLYEVLLYKNIPLAASQTALIANMKTYYGIP